MVGNKIESTDPPRVISKAQGEKEAEKQGWGYEDVSAETEDNIENLFNSIFKDAWEYRF